jgi:hypothetical protein
MMSAASLSNATPLAVGSSVTDRFSGLDGIQWYKLSLVAGQTYLFSMEGVDVGGGLSDFSGVFLGLGDSAGHGIDSESVTTAYQPSGMEFTATRTGDYFLVAQNATGQDEGIAYRIKAAVAAPDDFADGTATTGVIAAGGSVQGVSEVNGDRDWFKFHADAGKHYGFAGVLVDGASPVEGIRIYDAAGKLLTPGGTNTGFDALASGDYYVSVEGDGTGAYTLASSVVTDDYAQDNNTRGLIGPGLQTAGKIDYVGDVDRFKMVVQAGASRTVELSSGPDGHPLSVQWRDASGALLDYTTFHTASGAWDYTLRAAASGSYYLDVGAGSQYGFGYTIKGMATPQDEYGDTIASAASLAVGATIHGAIQTPADVDLFKLALTAGTTYTFDLQPQGGTPSGVLSLAVRGGDGATLDSHVMTDAANGQFFTFTPTVTGNYYLDASAATGDMSAAYTLSVTPTADDVGASAATAGHLAVGSSVHGELEKGGGDSDWFAVSLAAGQTYWFTVGGAVEGQGTLAQGGAQLTLLDARGKELAQTFSGDDHVHTAPLLPFTAASAGTYYVQVAAGNHGSGTYQLQAQVGVQDDVGNDAAHATHIDMGKVQSGVNETAVDVDVFAVDVVAGATYGLTLDTPYFYYPDVLSLAVTDGAQTALSLHRYLGDSYFTATSTGTYYVTVAHNANGTSGWLPYTLKPVDYGIDDFSADASTTGRLAVNGAVQGRIDFPDDADDFRVHLEAGHRYVFDLHGTQSGGGSLDTALAQLSLLDGGGHAVAYQRLQGAGNEAQLLWTASASGDYDVDAGDAAGIGSYTLAATDVSLDATPPVLTGTSAAAGVGLSDAIRLSFNEAVMLSSGGSVTLTDAGGVSLTLLSGNGSVDIHGNTLTLAPAINLAPGASYTVQVSGLTDLAGNPCPATSFTFSTVAAVAQGGDGNDVLISKGSGVTLDGGAGIDTVYYDDRASGASVSRDANGHWIIQKNYGAADTLLNVERVVFSSHALALDIDGHGGQAYRLYQAAFDRTPDEVGLGFWIQSLDKGASLRDVATAFVQSAEFASLYGANPGDADFLTLLYNNVLHRAPDTGGAAYWTGRFQQGLSHADALASFSESGENQAQVIGQLSHGIAYLPYH